jgi:hypothetical protein
MACRVVLAFDGGEHGRRRLEIAMSIIHNQRRNEQGQERPRVPFRRRSQGNLKFVLAISQSWRLLQKLKVVSRVRGFTLAFATLDKVSELRYIFDRPFKPLNGGQRGSPSAHIGAPTDNVHCRVDCPFIELMNGVIAFGVALLELDKWVE